MLSATCSICDISTIHDMIFCDYCNKAFHYMCLNLPSTPLGFFYCNECMNIIISNDLHTIDVTMDFSFLDFLINHI